jgi:hypothetical protein
MLPIGQCAGALRRDEGEVVMIEALAFALVAVAIGLPGLITAAVEPQFESQTNRKPEHAGNPPVAAPSTA